MKPGMDASTGRCCAEKNDSQAAWQSGSRSRRCLGGVRFLTTSGVGIFCPTPDVQLDKSLHHTPKLGIPAEKVQFLLKLLLKQRFLAVHHDLH